MTRRTSRCRGGFETRPYNVSRFARKGGTLLVSVFAYLLWFHLLTVSGATAASSYHFMMPPLGMLFGWLLLGEHVAPTDLAGIVPVAIGIYLVTCSSSLGCRNQRIIHLNNIIMAKQSEAS